jgi:hypothetical protein
MTPFEYLKKHVNTKLAPSKVHGVGIVALRDLEIGESVFTNWEGESGVYYLTEDELNSLDDNLKSHVLDMFEFEKVDDKWMLSINLNKNCHWIFKTPLHWVNSCHYNETPNFDKTTLTTMKKIKVGDELYTRYGKYVKFKSINII